MYAVAAYGLFVYPSMHGESAICKLGGHFILSKPSEQWAVGREYRERLKYAFDQNNIEIPFPHTSIYWGEEINPLKLEINSQILDELKQQP